MMFLATRNVFAFVPVVLHEVEPLAAGIVFAAVLRPLLDRLYALAHNLMRMISLAPALLGTGTGTSTSSPIAARSWNPTESRPINT